MAKQKHKNYLHLDEQKKSRKIIAKKK